MMGLMWALVWAPVAVLLGVFVLDPDNSMDEMWPMVGAMPGFLGGVVFSIVLGIAARHRRFDELSIPRFAAWGALAGLLVGTLPFMLGTPTSALPLWMLAAVVIGPITLLSAVSAAGSLALARRAARRDPHDAGEAPLLGAARPDDLPRRERVAQDPITRGGTR
ncbi:MAG: hypothetical protein ACXW05_12905 [Gemmatirosa sp.]